MHYSRLILNPRSRAVRRDLAEAFEMHRTIMSAFPQLSERDRRDPDSGSILWRVDDDQSQGVTMLLVQSELAPDWQPLLKRHPDYVATAVGSELPPIETKVRQLSFVVGQILSFRLRANPTKKMKADGRKNGIRVALNTEDEQLAWLQRKAETAGFRFGSAVVTPEGTSGPRGSNAPPVTLGADSATGAVGTVATTVQVARKMTHLAVRFEGVLQVTDAAGFEQTLRCGIGSAKGFGFGLLSLARI